MHGGGEKGRGDCISASFPAASENRERVVQDVEMQGSLPGFSLGTRAPNLGAVRAPASGWPCRKSSIFSNRQTRAPVPLTGRTSLGG